MSAITTADMPAPVRAYFEAMNNYDNAAMVAVFSTDALVNDVQREFWGPESITGWSAKEIVADKVHTTKFVEAKAHHGNYLVSAEFDGDYDKTGLPDPLVLTLYFSLDNNQITQLIILHNKPGY
jgi:hypothetical protein